MLILGIETSCDETSAAVLEDEQGVRSSVVATQHDVHCKYGGVVPELASRKHMENVGPAVQRALDEAGVSLGDLDALAVTRGPGLVVSLLVGVSMAKALAYAAGLPLVGVHHIDAHLHSPFIEGNPDYPFLGAVFSGGHTHLYRAEGHGRYELLGATRDDAAGEAYDKVAKLLGLGYPGGPVIDNMYFQFREARARGEVGEPLELPRAFLGKDSLDFSFSGVKTAVLYFLMERGYYSEDPSKPPWERSLGCPEELALQVAAGFQEAVAEVLVEKIVRAARRGGLREVVVTGGVASNRLLRERLARVASREGWRLLIPRPSLCTDNAPMVACVAYYRLKAEGEEAFRDYLDMDAEADLPLDSP